VPIEKQAFRNVLGHFAAGVTVITTVGPDGTPYGLTATAFSSVSLIPPLVLVCVDKRSETYSYFGSSKVFAANFLSREQQNVSQRFAVSGGDKFDEISWRPGTIGAPILDGTIGHVECRLRHEYDGGDHTIYVGEVESAAAEGGEPLIYFRGAYR
jgi:3-hydroxy-9,10-secoandrosta-1,3,5(10)-triene-9,17-dione monooxygenase reductase component